MTPTFVQKLFSIKQSTLVVTVIVSALVAGGGYVLFWPKATTYQFVTVERRAITESVSVTGNTIPASNVSLGFGGSGSVLHVYTSEGKTVKKGSVLAELDTTDLYAQIRQAQANVAVQQAKLLGLQAGSRSEEVAASQAGLDKASQDLENLYATINDSIVDAYAKANDAVKVQLNAFFSNGGGDSPTLSYVSANSQAVIDAESQRVLARNALTDWQTQPVLGNQSSEALDAVLKDNLSRLFIIRQLLLNVSKTLEVTPALDATTLATYKANATIAMNEVNVATKNLNTISQSIASQKLTVAQLQAQLNLKIAGTSTEDLIAQEAQVESARAALQSIEAKLQNVRIVAPMNGVVTQFDAKVGQFATVGTPLVSIISADTFEIEAQVSEIDIGKIIVGNSARMTFDAFPNEDFTGTVFYIDPAQTTAEGVVGYKIKVSLDKSDRRLKSGLTVNLNIETRSKADALVLAQYAILQNDEGTFVQKLDGDTVVDVSVTLGLQDQEGNVEIVSGVSEGDKVLNIGLKQ